METWLSYLNYYSSLDKILGKFNSELYLFLILIPIFIIEILTQGWRKSTFSSLIRPGKTDYWDFFSFIILIFNGRRILTNYFYLGLAAFIIQKTEIMPLAINASLPIYIKIAVSILVYDFLYYWFHRARHSSPWLWNVHELHHSSTRVTLFTTYRVHPLDYFFLFVMVYLPLHLLIGLNIMDTTIFSISTAFFGFFNHCRIDSNLGWLGKYIFVSPRFHHMHHSIDGYKFHNYGEIFVFWDKIFGSYKEPTQSLHDIKQGIEDNIYENLNPIPAFLIPVWRFYLYPIKKIKKWFNLALRFP